MPETDNIYRLISYGFVRGKLDGFGLVHEYEDLPAPESHAKAKPKVEPIKLIEDWI